MQVTKKHFPVVGLLSLVLIGVAAGSIYYYQFVTPHARECGAPVHRIIFLEAIIEEQGGFSISSAAVLNQTGSTPPAATNQTSSALNFTGVQFSNYTVTNPRVIEANAGDTITIYMLSVNGSSPQWPPTPPARGLGHGLGVDQFTIPKPLQLVTWDKWGSTSFTVAREGVSTFRCLHDCSPQHGSMTGTVVVSGCA